MEFIPWVGQQCVIVAFPGHTHFFIESILPCQHTISTINMLFADKQESNDSDTSFILYLIWNQNTHRLICNNVCKP